MGVGQRVIEVWSNVVCRSGVLHVLTRAATLLAGLDLTVVSDGLLIALCCCCFYCCFDGNAEGCFEGARRGLYGGWLAGRYWGLMMLLAGVVASSGASYVYL